MDQIQKKLMTKFSDKLKKNPTFGPFSQFLGQFFLKKTPSSVLHNNTGL